MNYEGFILGCITVILILLIVCVFIYPNTIYDSSIILLTAISSIAWIIVYMSTRTLHCKQNDNPKELICEIKGSREYNTKYGGDITISDDNKTKLWQLINFLKLKSNDNKNFINNVNNGIILNKLLLTINEDLVNTNNNTNIYQRSTNYAETLLRSIGVKIIEDKTNYDNNEDYLFLNINPDLIDLNLENNGYTLIGKIVYTPGHFIAYIKKDKDKWYKIDSLNYLNTIPEVDIDIVNLTNDYHMPYIWLYSKQKDGKDNVINRKPYHLLHFTNICYVAAPLQLLLATNLLDMQDSENKIHNINIKNKDNKDIITVLNEIKNNYILVNYDSNNNDVKLVLEDIESYINKNKFDDIDTFINTIYNKLDNISIPLKLNKLYTQLENWIQTLDNIKKVLDSLKLPKNDKLPDDLQPIINNYIQGNQKNNKINEVLQQKIQTFMNTLYTIYIMSNDYIRQQIYEIIKMIGNIYKTERTTNILIDNTFNSISIDNIDKYIYNIIYFTSNDQSIYSRKKATIKDNNQKLLNIYKNIIIQNTTSKNLLLSKLLCDISDNNENNNDLFKSIINDLYDNRIKDNNYIPKNYKYDYQDLENNKNPKLELNTYKLFYKYCKYHITLFNELKKYNEDEYKRLSATDNNNKKSFIENMAEFIEYMDKSFDTRMLENVNMIIGENSPKQKINNIEVPRYDIHNFIPNNYREYIYRFSNREIDKKWKEFNIVYKLIKWENMLKNDIDLQLLSNEDDGDELAEEENEEGVNDYDTNIDNDKDNNNQSIYHIKRQPIRNLIKSKFIDGLNVNNKKLQKIIIQKAKRLFRLFKRHIHFNDIEKTEKEINNFINFVNNPFITYDEVDIGSDEPYISYASSYSPDNIKKISKRYGTDTTSFDKFYKELLNSEIL